MESANTVSQNFNNAAPAQQNGNDNYSLQYNFNQGSTMMSIPAPNDQQPQQQHPQSMNNSEIPQQPQNTNNTFYWNVNEFSAPANSTINWGYYTNYTLPQPQVAMPVVEFPAQNQETANQIPVTTSVPSNFNFQSPPISDSNNGYPPGSFFAKEQVHFSESQIIPVQQQQQAPAYFHQLPQTSESMNVLAAFPYNQNQNIGQPVQSLSGVQQNIGQNNLLSKTNSSEQPKQEDHSSRRTSTVSMQDCQDSTSSGDLPSNSSGTSKSGSKSECDMCNKIFCNSTSLKRHKRLVHKVDQPSGQSRQSGKTTDFMCELCGKYFCNRCSLQRHKSTVVDCYKRVSSMESQDISLKEESDEMTQESEVSNNERNMSFDFNSTNLPGTSTVDLSQLSDVSDFKYDSPKNGNESSNSTKRKTETCHICSKGFTTKGALYRHMKNIHNKYSKSEDNSNSEITNAQTTLPTSHTQFNRGFDSAQSAINNSAKDNFSDIFKLVIEDGMQNDSDNMQVHQSSNSQDEDNDAQNSTVKSKEKKCPTCQKVLANFKSLKRHQLVAHGIKRGSSSANNNTTPPASLSHNSSSSGGTPDSEICDICHKLISKSNMRRHKIFVHKIKFSNSSDEEKKDPKQPAQRKRPCVYCSRLISWGNLLRHQRTNHKFELERDQKLVGGNMNRAIVKQETKDNFEDLIKIEDFQPSNYIENNDAANVNQNPPQEDPQPQPPLPPQPEIHQNYQPPSQNNWLEQTHSVVQSEIHHDLQGLQATWVQAASIAEMDTLESLVYKTLEGNSADLQPEQYHIDTGLKTELLGVESDVHQDFNQSAWIQPSTIQPLDNLSYTNLGQPSADIATTNELKGDTVVMQPETSECPICEEMVLTSDIRDHKNNHELVCHICGKEDICLKDVSSHGATHVADLVCEVCGYKAQAKVKLWEHMNAHLGIRPLVCLECGWSFGNSGSVQYHMKQYHSTIDELAKCNHCERVFPTEQAKRGHEVSHYGTTCPYCQQEFERKKDLAVHIKTAHYSRRKQD